MRAMELIQIADADALDAALSAPAFLLFKHSLICPTSAAAFNEYRHFLAGRDDAEVEIPTAWLDVRGQRPLSLAVEARTGVRHESPQALYLSRGRAVWHASHGAITRAGLREALAAHAG
jgi:bacillithiol system protein YtxJ